MVTKKKELDVFVVSAASVLTANVLYWQLLFLSYTPMSTPLDIEISSRFSATRPDGQ